MDMTFREKSSWGSLLALGAVAYWYFPRAFGIASNSNDATDIMGISFTCIVALIIIEAIYHSIIAGKGGDMIDERDILIDLKAERIASYVLGIGLFLLVGHIVTSGTSERFAEIGKLSIVVWILFTITVSEVSKLSSRIAYYRVEA